MLQSKYDYWQMDDNIFCEMFHLGHANLFGAFFERTFNETFAGTPSTGYLLDSCTHHCGGWDLLAAVRGRV